jgi:hypothetical protein
VRQAADLYLSVLEDPTRPDGVKQALSGDWETPFSKALLEGNFSVVPLAVQLALAHDGAGLKMSDGSTIFHRTIQQLVGSYSTDSDAERQRKSTGLLQAFEQIAQAFEKTPPGKTSFKDCLSSKANFCTPLLMAGFCHNVEEAPLSMKKTNIEPLISFFQKMSRQYDGAGLPSEADWQGLESLVASIPTGPYQIALKNHLVRVKKMFRPATDEKTL